MYPFGGNWGLRDFLLYSFGGFSVRVRCLRNPGVFVPQLDKEGRHFLAWVGGCISGLVICEAGELLRKGFFPPMLQLLQLLIVRSSL